MENTFTKRKEKFPKQFYILIFSPLKSKKNDAISRSKAKIKHFAPFFTNKGFWPFLT